jgi:hypothetical protein
VLNHLSIFREIVSNLLSMEVKYEDEDLALLLLVSMPSSYTNFSDTICISLKGICPRDNNKVVINIFHVYDKCLFIMLELY